MPTATPGTGSGIIAGGWSVPTTADYSQQSPTQAATGLGTLKGQVAGATETGFLGSLPPSLQGLLGGSTTGTSGSTGSTGSTGVAGSSGVAGTGASSPIPQIAPTDPTAANAATFANAKNQVGQTSRASLDALNGELGSQGMLGGGAAVQGARDVVNAGQTQLGAVTNQNAITDAAQTQADTLANLSAATTGRGQDIQAQEAAATEALAANNQQFQQSYLKQQQLQNMLNMALSGINNPSVGLAPTS